MEKRSEICDFNDVERICLTGETSGRAVLEFIVNWTEKAGNVNASFDRLIIDLRDDINGQIKKNSAWIRKLIGASDEIKMFVLELPLANGRDTQFCVG